MNYANTFLKYQVLRKRRKFSLVFIKKKKTRKEKIQKNELKSLLSLCFKPPKSWFKLNKTVSEFNEFKSRLKYPKNRFQLSAGLNLEKFNTILSGTNHI